MSPFSAILPRATAAMLIAVPFAVSASAQTTSPAPASAAVKKPAVATPRLIDEAIQRSQARTTKERDLRVPEQFGSEEPFTYVPGKTN